MSRIIPETVNELGMAEAFRFYRDELKLHVYPVDGPWSKKADPGKKPSVKAWWNYDPKECGVAEFFKPQRCHNIGVCPTKHLYIVDLDSKTDQGESIYEFIAEHKELAAIPRHRTRGGCHLVFFCDDVPPIRKPRSNKPYDKPLFSKLSDTVGAEFYHSDHQNVVFPSSIHPTMFKYVWEVTGAIPTVSWQRIVETFGFRLPGEKEQKPKEEREIPFELNFRGDFKFLDMVKVADVLNLAPELLNAEDSKYAITCPGRASIPKPRKPIRPRRSSTRKNSGRTGRPLNASIRIVRPARSRTSFYGRRAGRRASSTGIARSCASGRTTRPTSTASRGFSIRKTTNSIQCRIPSSERS